MRTVEITDDLTIIVCESRGDWLRQRSSRIGGSDAAAVLGKSPWKTNQRLWEEKTGRVEPEDIGDKPYVQYGHDAEPYIRALYALDHPDEEVGYIEDNLFLSASRPWAHASLDGWIKDADGRMGVLEIKTTTVLSSMSGEHWRGQIPDTYYCQVLHYLMVTGWSFAELRAHLKYSDGYTAVRTYHIERADVEGDIRYLSDREQEFYKCIKEDRQPSLVLPEI